MQSSTPPYSSRKMVLNLTLILAIVALTWTADPLGWALRSPMALPTVLVMWGLAEMWMEKPEPKNRVPLFLEILASWTAIATLFLMILALCLIFKL